MPNNRTWQKVSCEEVPQNLRNGSWIYEKFRLWPYVN
jgi:hypothetical protein